MIKPSEQRALGTSHGVLLLTDSQVTSPRQMSTHTRETRPSERANSSAAFSTGRAGRYGDCAGTNLAAEKRELKTRPERSR